MNNYSMIAGGETRSASIYADIFDPSTNDLVGQCPQAQASDVDNAVGCARRAFPLWAGLPDNERQRLIGACADLIDAQSEGLARLLTQEQGKPLNGLGSRFELGGAVAWTRHTASLSLPVETVSDDQQVAVAMYRRPLGVIASITPWNWPLLIAIWHIMPALRAGNTVVIKPSPFTPLSTLRLVEMLNTLLPPGVLNSVTGDASVGDQLTGHPDVAKVVFTGSTATGRKVMERSAPTLKRLTLELGGNDAGIVLPDADPEAIAEGLFWGAFINGGQTCAALKRLYVHSSQYEDVCDALVRVAARIPMGNGLDEASLLGPLQNAQQLHIVEQLVDAARRDGARVLTGGKRWEGVGLFYPVTLVADAMDGMGLVDEEQFGPALPIIRYDELEGALRAANALNYGLGGSIWSSDRPKAAAIAARMECGSVWINAHGAIRPDAPFGGVKGSGIGVQFGQHGLNEFTWLQSVHV